MKNASAPMTGKIFAFSRNVDFMIRLYNCFCHCEPGRAKQSLPCDGDCFVAYYRSLLAMTHDDLPERLVSQLAKLPMYLILVTVTLCSTKTRRKEQAYERFYE